MTTKKTEQVKNELPSKEDFDPWNGDLDALWAWKNFGGLGVDEAYSKFCEFPESYQEDFMFMGPKAFAFYFPVLEKYMTTVQPEDELDDCCGWIIGYGVESQLEDIKSERLLKRIFKLSEIVVERFKKFSIENSDKLEVINKWEEIKTKIHS